MKQQYCLPILQTKTKKVLKIILENKTVYDFFEVWLDYIKDLNSNFIETLIKKFDGKLIFLFRRQNLGAPKMSFQKRIEVINLIAGSKCLLDLDVSQKKELEYLKKKSKKIRLIASYHNYKETPSRQALEKIIQNMNKYSPEIYKISTFCNKDSDALLLTDFLSSFKETGLKCIVLGMGKKGIITRIAGAIVGNEISFAPLFDKGKSAAGQLTKFELEKILKKIKVCYFVADPIEHSLSPQMHNCGYKVLGIENNFIFLRRLVKSEDLKKFIDGVRKNPNFRGASISIPHKIEIMKYLDEIDKVAKVIGAVNTIVKKGKKLKGYNTDYLGILHPLKRRLNLKGKTAAVLGAGGAARAAVYVLVTQGAKVNIFNRSLEKAQNLANNFNCKFDSLVNINKIPEFDIVINTTKVGLSPADPSLLPKNLIRPNQIIFDVVYSKTHPQTKLIKMAKERKAKIISGVEMLAFQGVEQFKLFTNKSISVEVMRRAL